MSKFEKRVHIAVTADKSPLVPVGAVRTGEKLYIGVHGVVFPYGRPGKHTEDCDAVLVHFEDPNEVHTRPAVHVPPAKEPPFAPARERTAELLRRALPGFDVIYNINI